MNRFTRALAGALAAVLAVGSLAACGEKKRKLPEKQVLDHVYKYETKTLATYDEVKWDEDAQKDFKGYTEVQDTVLSPAGYAYRTVTVDKDYNTTAQSVSFGRFDGSDPVTVDTGLPTGSGDAVYFSATAVVPQGLAAVMDENRVVGEQKVDGETVPIYEQKPICASTALTAQSCPRPRSPRRCSGLRIRAQTAISAWTGLSPTARICT